MSCGLFHVRKRANLSFERLVVLAFDLQFGLQFLDEQIEMSDLDAQLLDVGSRGGWPRCRSGGWWRVGLR